MKIFSSEQNSSSPAAMKRSLKKIAGLGGGGYRGKNQSPPRDNSDKRAHCGDTRCYPSRYLGTDACREYLEVLKVYRFFGDLFFSE